MMEQWSEQMSWFQLISVWSPKKWPPPLTFCYYSYYQTGRWHLQLLLKKVAGSPSEPEIKCPQAGLVVLSNQHNQQGTFFAWVNGIILQHLSPKFQNWAFWRDSGFHQQQKTTSAWFHFSRWHESPTVQQVLAFISQQTRDIWSLLCCKEWWFCKKDMEFCKKDMERSSQEGSACPRNSPGFAEICWL